MCLSRITSLVSLLKRVAKFIFWNTGLQRDLKKKKKDENKFANCYKVNKSSIWKYSIYNTSNLFDRSLFFFFFFWGKVEWEHIHELVFFGTILVIITLDRSLDQYLLTYFSVTEPRLICRKESSGLHFERSNS